MITIDLKSLSQAELTELYDGLNTVMDCLIEKGLSETLTWRYLAHLTADVVDCALNDEKVTEGLYRELSHDQPVPGLTFYTRTSS